MSNEDFLYMHGSRTGAMPRSVYAHKEPVPIHGNNNNNSPQNPQGFDALRDLQSTVESFVISKLGPLHPRPLECATAVAGVVGYATTLYHASGRELARIEKAALIASGVSHLSEIYHLVADANVIKVAVSECINAFKKAFNDYFYPHDEPQALTSKSFQALASIGAFFAAMLGLQLPAPALALKNYQTMSSSVADIGEVLLWDFFGVDVTGQKLLKTTLSELEEEGTRIQQTAPQELHGDNMVVAERWLNQATSVAKSLGKATTVRLNSLITLVGTRISDAKIARYNANTKRAAPVSVLLHGGPGSGKSTYITEYLIPYLAKVTGSDDRIFSLNTGNHASHYAGELWGFYDEFGATTKASESHMMASLNNICSGFFAPIPGAAVEDKHQAAMFAGVFFASNRGPNALVLGLVPEAHEAFLSRMLIAEVNDPAYNPNRTREGQTHRMPNFGHLDFTVNGEVYTGPEFAQLVAEHLAEKQRNFNDKQAIGNQFDDLHQQFTLARDVPQAKIGRTIWITGKPGVGKTTTALSYVKAFSKAISMPYKVLPELGPAIKRPEEKSIFVLDDIIDPTTKEGQQEFADFYDRVIGPSASIAVVVSNYGPRLSKFSLNRLWYTHEWEPVDVLLPAFGRRSGFDSRDVGTVMVMTATPEAYDPFKPSDRSTIARFLTRELAGLGASAPLEVIGDLPNVLPFQREDADVWLEFDNDRPTPGDVLSQAMSNCSLRAIAHLRNVNLRAEFTWDVFLSMYRKAFKEHQDIKMMLRAGSNVCICDGSQIFITRDFKAPRITSGALNEETIVWVEVEDVRTPITRSDYITYISGTYAAGDENRIDALSQLVYIEATAPGVFNEMSKKLGLTAWDKFQCWLTRTKGHKSTLYATIAGLGVAGALVSAIVVMMRTFITKDETQGKSGKAGFAPKYFIGGRKKPQISDSEPMGFEEDAWNIKYNFETHMDRYTSDDYIPVKYQARGKTRLGVIRPSTQEYYLDLDSYKDFADIPEVMEHPNVTSPHSQTLTPLIKKVHQNHVGFHSSRGTSYALMMNESVGVVPNHLADDLTYTISFIVDKVVRRYEAVPLYRDPERELAFFQLRHCGKVFRGPFTDITRYMISIDEAVKIKTATVVFPVADSIPATHTGPYNVNKVVKSAFTAAALNAWRVNVGYIYYGTQDCPTANGHCGSAVVGIHGDRPVLLGIHAVNRVYSQKIGSSMLVIESWNEFMGSLDKPQMLENTTRVTTFESVLPSPSPAFVPDEVYSLMSTKVEDGLVPTGPGLARVGTMRTFQPSDTNSKKYWMDTKMEDIFPISKVPTLPAATIEREMADKVTPDANGNKYCGYTRLAKMETNVGKVDKLGDVLEMASELAQALKEEAHLERERIEPLSVRDAVAGNKDSPPMKRTSANGSVLDSLFKVSGKSSLIDYSDETRELVLPTKGSKTREWIDLQYDMAKRGQRLVIPATVGLKSELLPEEKLHKKRAFMITPTPTWINQKRLFLPVQNILTRDIMTTRFPLVFDPVIDTHELVTGMLSTASKFAAFDFSGFDATVPIEILMGVGEIMGAFYDTGRESALPLRTAVLTMMEDVASMPFLYDTALITKKGGVASGMGCTSLVDSLAVLLSVWIVMKKKFFKSWSAREFLANVTTRHGGDDLVIGLRSEVAKKVDINEFCACYMRYFKMTLTSDTKKELTEKAQWLSITEVSFLSRRFVKMAEAYTVWISVLKTESLAGAALYSSTADPVQQLTQLEAMAPEIYGLGEATYTLFREKVATWAKAKNMSSSIPSYSVMTGALRAAIVLKEPAETSTLGSINWVSDIALIPWKYQANENNQSNMPTEGPSRAVRSTFCDALRAARSWTELMSSSAASRFFAALDNVSVVKQTVKYKTSEYDIFPRNGLGFWYVASRPKETGPHADYANTVLISMETVLDSDAQARPILVGVQAAASLLKLVLAEKEIPDTLYEEVRAWALNVTDIPQGGVISNARMLSEATEVPDIFGHIRRYIIHKNGNVQKIEQDIPQSGPPATGLLPATGGDPPAAKPSATPGTAAPSAMQQYEQDFNAVGVAAAPNPPAAIDGSGAQQPTVLESLGGMDGSLLPISGYMNSIIASCYQPCPLETINVGTETAEGTILYETAFDPWDPAFAGPYISAFVGLHDRFSGSIKLGLSVASAGTILGKLGLYYVPGGAALPERPNRTNMFHFQHVIVDMQTPSEENMSVRPTHLDRVTAIDRATSATGKYGKIYLIAITNIANTYGAATLPPVYVKASFGPDAMVVLPNATTRSGPEEVAAPPLIPIPKGFAVMDGKNISQTRITFKGPRPTVLAGKISGGAYTPSGIINADDIAARYAGADELVYRFGYSLYPDSVTDSQWKNNPMAYLEAHIENTQMYLGINRDGVGVDQTRGPDAIQTINTLYDTPYGNSWSNYPANTNPGGEVVPGKLYAPAQRSGSATYVAANARVYSAPYSGYYYMEGNEEIPISLTSKDGTMEVVVERYDAHKIGGTSDALGIIAKVKGVKYTRPQTPAIFAPIKHKTTSPEFGFDLPLTCTKAFPATPGAIPFGYKTITVYDPDDDRHQFGIPAVTPGLSGTTMIPANAFSAWLEAAAIYLGNNNLASYTLRYVGQSGQAAFDVVVNIHGAFVYSPQEDYTFCDVNLGAFDVRLVGTSKISQWPILRQPTRGLFKERTTGSTNGGSIRAQLRDLYYSQEYDVPQSAAVGAALGGIFNGLGSGFGMMAQYKHEKAMQARHIDMTLAIAKQQAETAAKQQETTRLVSEQNNRTATNLAVMKYGGTTGLRGFAGADLGPESSV